MSTDRVTLQVALRTPEQLGSRNVRRLRKQGLIPGVLYGSKSGTHAFVVEERALRNALSGPSGLHTLMDVELEGASHTAVVKDYQRHPVRGTLTHLDLHEIRLDRPIQASVQLVVVGESPGVRQGGILQQGIREARIEALPTAIPDQIEVSIDELELGGVIHLADAQVPAGVTLLDDPDTVIASCVAPRGPTAEEEAELEAAEGGEETEGAETGESSDDDAEE